MSERGPSFYPEETLEKEVEPVESETRFGDKAELISIMETGTAEVKGRIEDFYKVPEHRNVVEMAHVRMENGGSRNITEFVTIDDEAGHHLECVFKPVRGEAKKFYAQNGLGHDYPREVASYLVSEHFGLDLVPPTVLRQIRGQVGSLQLLMPFDHYELGGEALNRIPEEEYETFMHSADVHNLQALDWIIANADRHVNNYLFKVDQDRQPILTNGVPQIVAIDNGLAFNELFYRLKANRNDLPGPYQHLTRDNMTKALVATQLPPLLREKIALGMADRAPITEALLSLPDIDEREIERMWQRTQALVDTGVFLSGYNYREHTRYPIE